MPLLIKMALSLWDSMPVHDMKNLISNLLTISRAFSDEANHGSKDVCCRQEPVFFRFSAIVFVLLADLIGKSNLSSLQLSRLRIVASLPIELLCETVSEPDVEVDDIVCVFGIYFVG